MSRVQVKVDGVMVAVAVLVPLAIYAGYKIVRERDSIVSAVNPMSDQNLAYRGVNAGWGWALGWDEHETIGGYAADKVHGVKSWWGDFFNGLFN